MIKTNSIGDGFILFNRIEVWNREECWRRFGEWIFSVENNIPCRCIIFNIGFVGFTLLSKECQGNNVNDDAQEE